MKFNSISWTVIEGYVVRNSHCAGRGDVYLIRRDVFGHRTGCESVEGVGCVGSLSSLHEAGL